MRRQQQIDFEAGQQHQLADEPRDAQDGEHSRQNQEQKIVGREHGRQRDQHHA